MNKTKVPTFIGSNAQTKVLVNNQSLTLKEERNLVSGFVIVARSPLLQLTKMFTSVPITVRWQMRFTIFKYLEFQIIQ